MRKASQRNNWCQMYMTGRAAAMAALPVIFSPRRALNAPLALDSHQTSAIGAVLPPTRGSCLPTRIGQECAERDGGDCVVGPVLSVIRRHGRSKTILQG